MNDPFLDHVPSHEREKIRKRMRTPEAYEKTRDKVKGPEELARDMEKNERMAEFRYSLETKPEVRESLRQQIEKDVKEHGVEALLELRRSSPETKKAIESGKFRIVVSSHPTHNQDILAVVPEGKVQERIPLKPAASERYLSQGLKVHDANSF